MTRGLNSHDKVDKDTRYTNIDYMQKKDIYRYVLTFSTFPGQLIAGF